MSSIALPRTSCFERFRRGVKVDQPLDRIGMPSAFRGSSFPEGLSLLELAPLALRSVPAEFGP